MKNKSIKCDTRAHLGTAPERGSATRSNVVQKSCEEEIVAFVNPDVAAARRAALRQGNAEMRPDTPNPNKELAKVSVFYISRDRTLTFSCLVKFRDYDAPLIHLTGMYQRNMEGREHLSHDRRFFSNMIKAIFIVFLAASLGVRGDVIAQWNFNSAPPDGSSSTGTASPSIGAGSASLVGSASATFASGDSSLDPAGSTDNTGWNTTTYPTQSTGNKTRGVQFSVSTQGRDKIAVSWSQRNSNTASRYARLQYSTNGVDFIDFTAISDVSSNLFVLESNSLAAVTGAADNANFAFRIVTEWESTAIGNSNTNYVPTSSTNTYGTSGTIRFDMVTIYGSTIVGGNTPPTISSPTNQTIRVNTTSPANPFTVSDAETAPDQLSLSSASSNTNLLETNHIVFGGSGAARNVAVTPEVGQTGSTTITIYVRDSGGLMASNSFVLTVLPANLPPAISYIMTQTTLVNTAPPGIPFTISDPESDATNLTVTGTSSNEALVPNANIMISGTGSLRTATVTPSAGQSGVAVIKLTVNDGTNTATSTFPLMVVPSTNVLFYDPFNYADGSIVGNSAFLWNPHSGTPGQMQVVSGQLRVVYTNSEDVSGTLIGGPYATNSSAILYSRFSLTLLALPGSSEFFAHFKDSGNTQHGKIYVSTTNAAPGFYRIGIANGGTSPAQIATDLSPNITYSIVTRYVVSNATSTIWVNPSAENDSSATATDITTLIAVNSYAFRENSGGILLNVDDLKIATTFADAVATTSAPAKLIVTPSGNNFQISWPTSAGALLLQSTTNIPSTNWLPVPQLPVINGDRNIVTITNLGLRQFFRLKL